MLPLKLKYNVPGRLAIGDGLERASSHVHNDGRATVQFHRNPSNLAAWFKRCHDEAAVNPERKIYGARKGSGAFLDGVHDAACPRLNIAIHVIGSRGDVQPFIPIAQMLQESPFGHRVRICTHPVFKDFVESHGIEFFSIGGDPEALMAYMVKNPGLLPSKESLKAGEVSRRRNDMAAIMDGCWRSCIEAGDGLGERVAAVDVAVANDLFIADAIIANPPSMAHIHCAEKLGVPLHMVFTMPWSPTHTFHHPLASMKYGEAETSVANYLSFIIMELLTWQGLGDVINKFRTRTLKLDPVSPLWGHQLLDRLQLPFTYLWSSSLIPKPQDWGSNIHIAGFSFLPRSQSYTPQSHLVNFLERGSAPIYIGFGSIVVDDPQALTNLILKALKLANVRAIISKGWGQIGGDDVPDNVYLVGDCPHDWLFQHVSCVVHHGGAGTTAAGIAAGCPTVVVPFFGDQPFWGHVVYRAGAGPKPVPFKTMTAESLAESITFALRPEVKAAAQKASEQVTREDGACDASRNIMDGLNSEDLKCDICPDRLAVYKHRKTGAHLSSFAAYYLVNRGVIKVHHLRLLRHKEWYVDEGAESVIIGIVAACSSFLTDIAIATDDYIQRVKSKPSPQSRRKSSVLSTVLDRSTHQNNNPDVLPIREFTPRQLSKIARKLAEKPPKDAEKLFQSSGPNVVSRPTWFTRKRTQGNNGHAYHVIQASGRYAVDLTRAGFKAPVTLMYNIANGFRNFPSYAFEDLHIRRRGDIRGIKSGFKVAGKELVFGFYDAFGGLVLRPYQGAQKDGAKGLVKGLLTAGSCFVSGIGSGLFGVPGYALRGIEKELLKHRRTELKAEMLLIRIRQGLNDLQQSTDLERKQIEDRWKTLHSIPHKA